MSTATATKAATKANGAARLDADKHLALLKHAIAANLDAREEHSKRAAEANRGKPPEFKFICAATLMATPYEQLDLEDMLEDPVRDALKRQLKDLGQRLFDLVGSTSKMQSIAEEIADLKPRNFGTRIDIIDKNWDGVGSGDHRWWA